MPPILLLSEALGKANPDQYHRMADTVTLQLRSTARLEPGPSVPGGVMGP